jgi:hypothetical protein
MPEITSPVAGFDFDAFVTGYIECALWADCWPASEAELMDGETGGREHLTMRPGAREAMIERGQLADFVEANADDLLAYCEERSIDPAQGSAESYAGHDFWLTRSGHGAGFWDRGLGALGDRLADAARVYGSPDDHTPYDRGDGTADV